MKHIKGHGMHKTAPPNKKLIRWWAPTRADDAAPPATATLRPRCGPRGQSLGRRRHWRDACSGGAHALVRRTRF
eukprot:468455-Pleurochrysis_carterae.AAC.1